MNESNVPPTPSENDPAPPQPPAPPPQEPPPPAPAPTQAVASDWGAGRIIAIVAGALLILVSVGLLGVGGVAVWAGFQRDGGYVTTDVQEFSASGSALATDPVDLGSGEGVSWVYSSDFLDSVRIRVTPTTSDQQLFVGIGRSAAVAGYLAGVSRTVISDFWGDDVKDVPGGTPESPPGEQDFWVASTHGSGTQTLVWDPSGGTWTAVVMNVDGRPGLDVKADLGGRIPHLGWFALGLLLLGAIVLAGGVLLIVLAIRRRRPVQAQAV